MLEDKKVFGIVLSGGKSSRMGTEKGLVTWNNKALIEYAIAAISPFCDQVIISSNKDCYSYLKLPVVKDIIPDCGPLGGVYSVMKKHVADIYIVVSCDVPYIKSELYSDLLSNLDYKDAVVPVDESGRKQPLTAVYGKSSLLYLENELLDGNYKMMSLLNLLEVEYYEINNNLPYYSPNLFLNANSLEDLFNH
ncbi:molybdenum cofactor guanylyltransferase [Ancylomarina longa]|uniref:Probable molybdenum cofactor guanylyltransferase n=1 Tax=Ancylomarina longa TaxID=2487017 RepID=A0A434AF48_9BACT|nr:molybdenum cofactor guanylyltransferase [Ancylomarina longa]RUT72999.1 molybdenum cofactor guanylyltransferase [Ancylomarina longa]